MYIYIIYTSLPKSSKQNLQRLAPDAVSGDARKDDLAGKTRLGYDAHCAADGGDAGLQTLDGKP